QAFRSVCVTWRGAVVDTAKLENSKVSKAEMQDYYDTHKSEFAKLDPQGRGLSYTPLDQVKDVVQTRTQAQKRTRLAAETAAHIATAWEAGKRDAEAEKKARVWELTSEPGDPPPAGVPQGLMDAVFGAPVGKSQGYRDATGGYAYLVSRRDTTCEASQAEIGRLALVEAAQRDRQALDDEARALLEKNPKRYQGGKTYYSSYLVVDPKAWSVSNITDAQMQQYYKDHPEEFGQAAGVHVRHILFAVTPRTDSTTALKRAQTVLAQAKAGAAFDSLAKVYSDDPATKNQGGDTGWFQRGMTSPEFEDLAFSLEPGQIGGPVRTRFGYHLVLLLEKREEKLNPFPLVAGAVGKAVAKQIADSLSYVYADSLARHFKTKAELTRISRARSYPIRLEFWSVGEDAMGQVTNDPGVRDAISKMRGPGPLHMAVPLPSASAVVWVDSLGAPRAPTWDTASEKAPPDALAARRARGRQGAIAAAQRELAAGAPWDSVVAPWGGSLDLAHRAGEPLPAIGASRQIDSLVFDSGTHRLTDGKAAVVSGVDGPVLVYLAGRQSTGNGPTADQKAALVDMMRERMAYEYFEKLKTRYPVKILRADLRRPFTAPVAP